MPKKTHVLAPTGMENNSGDAHHGLHGVLTPGMPNSGSPMALPIY